ncbi:MAG: hypothetical protein MUF54_11300 [Polyangiaceae bacterium]|nr:hypothetical protein [Polyangiaceae bacterium]
MGNSSESAHGRPVGSTGCTDDGGIEGEGDDGGIEGEGDDGGIEGEGDDGGIEDEGDDGGIEGGLLSVGSHQRLGGPRSASHGCGGVLHRLRTVEALAVKADAAIGESGPARASLPGSVSWVWSTGAPISSSSRCVSHSLRSMLIGRN